MSLPNGAATAAVYESPAAPARDVQETRPAVRRKPSHAGRLPGLDGLRAISVALVVTWHVAMNGLAHDAVLGQVWRFDIGNLGVRVFFVLSGFLITTLLLEEHAVHGRISLARFYFRRTLRIMPAYYVFLGAMAISAAVGWITVAPAAFLHAAAYLTNYLSSAWWIGHSWSLSVEEQFYLLWPGTLVLLGIRRGFRVAAVMLLAAPVFRVLATREPPLWPVYWRYAFECVADALATGCLLAYLRPRLWTWSRYRALLSGRAALVLPLALAVVTVLSVRDHTFAAVVGVSLMNVLIALIVDWALRHPRGAVGRALNSRPVAFVGTLSYSLYLWQQPFLANAGHLPMAVRLAAIAAAALLSYYLVERPALRLRSRLEKRLFAKAA
jgi:peptidoglycan/LPS O-acetylase OafA/YrhL